MNRKVIALVSALAAGATLLNHAAENRTILKLGPEGIDKWFGTVYNFAGVNNGILRVGGWGDSYLTLIKFEQVKQVLPGSFKRAELWLYAQNVTRPTDINDWVLASNWSEASGDHANLMGYDFGAYRGPNLGSGWYGLDVTADVGYWRAGTIPNFGWAFAPVSTDNKSDEFVSSDSTSASLRPELHLVYEVADFKLPLPADKAWKLTVEAGGKSYDGELDTYHTGRLFYSLDFSAWSVQASGIGPLFNEKNVPILAMAGGYVYDAGFDDANGNHVRIDHDGDGNIGTGLQTVYCHMVNGSLRVKSGDIITQGKLLGTMGETGYGSGIHLHVTFFNKGTAVGDGADPQLDQIKIEGRLIRDYKLNPTSSWTPIFYPSSNIMH